METKTCKFELKEIQEDGSFNGYLAVFGNKDLGDDVAERGCCKRTLDHWEKKGGKIPLTHFHDIKNPTGWFSAKEDDHGLFIDGQFILGIQQAKEDYLRMKAGVMNSLSIGYETIQREFKNGVRHLKEIRLVEGATLTTGAGMNPEAVVTQVKSVLSFQDLPLADKAYAWDAAVATKRVRTWAEAEEAPNAKYTKAFLWHDAENSDVFGAYKLPYADVIDGDLKAVPRAIYAAAGRLGQTQISDADKSKVRAHLGRYYSKLEEDAPWDKEGKSLFSVALANDQQERVLQEKRWKLDDALRTALAQLEDSEGMTTDDRVAAFDASLADYHQAMLGWCKAHFESMAAMQQQGMMPAKSDRDSTELKAGRMLSAVNKGKIEECVKVLQALLTSASGESDTDSHSDMPKAQSEPSRSTEQKGIDPEDLHSMRRLIETIKSSN